MTAPLLARGVSACMAGGAYGAACSSPGGDDSAPWMLLGALFFAWLGWTDAN